MDTYEERVDQVAAQFEREEREDIARMHPGLDIDRDREPNEFETERGYREYHVTVRHRRKYSLIDFGSSGKFMVDRETEVIYGIKSYGQVHKGHRYGTLSESHLPRRIFISGKVGA